jgi:hypothetical protein
MKEAGRGRERSHYHCQATVPDWCARETERALGQQTWGEYVAALPGQS